MNRLILNLLLVLVASPAAANTVVTFGPGSAVATIDRTATFDSLPDPAVDLATYTEALLKIRTPASKESGWPFGGPAGSGWWYPSGGFGLYDSWSQNLDLIGTSDGKRMIGIEFQFTVGALAETNFVWETYRNSKLIGSGIFLTPQPGTVVGWRDNSGIDELHVGAFVDMSNGSWRDNGLAIANLNVDLRARAVPAPSTAFLVGTALLELALSTGGAYRLGPGVATLRRRAEDSQ